MTPPKPAAFTPEGAPDGVEVRFVNFMAGRPKIRPRSIFVHTNGASGEGSVDSAWNWAHAAPNKNTVPHYQVDRAHNGVLRARKMLPSDRQGIANATITSSHKDWPKLTQAQRDSILAAGNKSIATWSLAIETADLGWPNPGGACGFEEQQGEMIAAILAYEAIVHGFPLVRLPTWDGAGVAAHTEPFTRPFTTLYVKPCPGDQKKADLWAWVLPRAIEIQNAWIGHPVVIDPPVVDPTPLPPGDLDMASSILCLEDDRPPHAYYRCDGVVKAWINTQDAKEQIDLRLAESAGGTKPAVDGFVYRYMRHGDPGVIASYGPIVGPVPDGHDVYGRH